MRLMDAARRSPSLPVEVAVGAALNTLAWTVAVTAGEVDAEPLAEPEMGSSEVLPLSVCMHMLMLAAYSRRRVGAGSLEVTHELGDGITRGRAEALNASKARRQRRVEGGL